MYEAKAGEYFAKSKAKSLKLLLNSSCHNSLCPLNERQCLARNKVRSTKWLTISLHLTYFVLLLMVKEEMKLLCI